MVNPSRNDNKSGGSSSSSSSSSRRLAVWTSLRRPTSRAPRRAPARARLYDAVLRYAMPCYAMPCYANNTNNTPT
eukprot:6700465-Heterocapsa_arctica.AAC.1